MTAVIETRELQKKYGKHLAVDGIGLRVEQGSVFGLIGPNGAGKTTVLRMLVDIIRPTAGELTVLGAVPRRSGTALRRRIGYLPGELKLAERIRGGTLLHHLAQISGPVDPGTIEALAERLGLDLGRPVRALSKGNRQKLGLIQAFMHRPELLILDEPTSGLDPLMQREFLAMVREAREAGQTVLLSSHILTEIQHTADDVAVLAGGRIVAGGDVSSLKLSSVARLRAVLAAIASISWGAAFIAGTEETGRLELTLAHAVGRAQYALESAAALVVKMLALGAVAFLLILAINAPAELDLSATNLLAVTLAWVSLGLLSGVAALAFGALTGRRTWAIGAGAGIAVLGYGLDAVGGTNEDLAWLSNLSPYHWAFGSTPLADGFDWGGLGLLWGLTATLIGITAWALSRRDILG